MPTTITNANSIFSTTLVGLNMTTGGAVAPLVDLTVDYGAFVLSTTHDALDFTGTTQTYNANINGDVRSYSTVATDSGIWVSTGNTANINIGQYGTVLGVGGILATGTGVANVSNAGTITANTAITAAIQEDASADYSISNAGRIVNINSAGVGIKLNGSGTHTLTNSGTISVTAGHNAIVSTHAAAIDNLTNSGTINGDIDLGGGIDTVTTTNGLINGVANLGDGNDIYVGSNVGVNTVDTVIGGLGNDTITGNAGNDILDGGADDDTIYGGDGLDTITGGGTTVGGYNTLVGGLGNDTYWVSNSSDVVTELYGVPGGIDTIKSSVDYTLGATSFVETLQAADALAITALTLTGNLNANTIIGNAGNNTLNGGTLDKVADILSGGLGNDTYWIYTSTDRVIEANSVLLVGGTDTINTAVDYRIATGVYAEILQTTDAAGIGAIKLAGNSSLGQTIIGNAGANVLDGGIDTFVDVLNGGAGNDTYILGSSTNDQVIDSAGIDTISSYASRDLNNYATIENLTMITVTASTASGNVLDNVILGSSSANTIDGRGGNDTLNGGLGNDTLTGGIGNDIFVFSTVLNNTYNKDVITDFSSAADTIKLENSLAGHFTALTTLGALAATSFVANATGAATTAAEKIVYNTTTGALYYDADGSGAGVAIQFATLGTTTHPTITNADFFVI
jgi:Ca2+-binding RTX toxin-like protein